LANRRAGNAAELACAFQKHGIYVFVVACSCAYYLLNTQILLGHYDLGWHLAAGDLIRAQKSVPLHDPWSFTAGDRQWFNLSWLWDVCASAIFQVAGLGGLLWLTVGCGAAIAFCLASICLRGGASGIAVCIAVLSACLLYPAFTAFPNIYLAASPNIATMLFAVLFYGACLRPTRAIYLLPVIMLFWANLHGGFLIGFFIGGIFCAVALLKRDWARFKTYLLVGAACFLATFINPLGWHIYQGVAATLGNFVQAYITEWWPYYRNISMPGSIPGMLYILAFVVLELRYRSPCPIEARLLAWLFLFLGLYQFRYMAFFFLFSTLPLALGLEKLLPRRTDDSKIEVALFFAGAVVACALPVIGVAEKPALPPIFSQADANYLETHFSHARLLNHWNLGGLLIFRTRGQVPIFVDGRANTAYPDAVLRDYFPLAQTEVNEKDWDRVLAKYKINTVLWMKSHDQLRQFLVGKRGWKEAYDGQFASIYVKP
jgi:hypothetical protein